MKKQASGTKKRSSNDEDSNGEDDAQNSYSYDENEDTKHTENVCRGRSRSSSNDNDNNNNGMGVARRPSPSPPSRPPRPSTSMRLIDEDDDDQFGKLKQSSSTDTVSTAAGSFANFSTGTRAVVPHTYKPPPGPRRSRSHRAQRQLYNRQLQLLATLSGGSVVFFLFFFLNFFAFAAMMIGVSSTSMLFYTVHAYAMYILNDGEGALFDYLPESLQNYLNNTSLHEAMTDDSSFLENRWYLLYFIPGLTPEQINALVARLPQRHRDMAHGPGGMARLALPDSVFRLIAPPNARGDSQSNAPVRTRMHSTGESGHVMRITEGEAPVALPVIVENESESEEQDMEEEITMRDAFRGILSNARNLVSGDNAIDTDVMNADEPQRTDFQDLQWDDSNDTELVENRIEVHIVDDSDSETSDLGLDVSADAFTGGMNNRDLGRLGRMLGLRQPQEVPRASRQAPASYVQPQPPTTVTATRDIEISHSLSDLPMNSISREEEDEVTIEEQQEAEGEIINEAISTMVDNFTTSASVAVSDTVINTAVSVVESVTPTLIRTGSRLSSFASVGLLGMFTSSRMQPVNIMGRTVGGGSRRLVENRTESFIFTGLVSTLVMGGISVGSAYATRFFTRRYLAAKRERSLENGTDDNRGENPSTN